jgi:hypothetical protein
MGNEMCSVDLPALPFLLGSNRDDHCGHVAGITKHELTQGSSCHGTAASSTSGFPSILQM